MKRNIFNFNFPVFLLYVMLPCLIIEGHLLAVFRPFSYFDDIFLLLLIGYLIYDLVKNRTIQRRFFFVLILLYTVVLIASVLVNHMPVKHGAEGIMVFIKPWLYFSIFLIRDRKGAIEAAKRIIVFIVIVGTLNSVLIVILRLVIGPYYSNDRAVGFLASGHTSGEYAFAAITYALYKIIFYRKWRFLLILCFAYPAIAIGGAVQYFLFAVALPVLIYVLKQGKTLRRLIPATILASLLVFTIPLLAPETTRVRNAVNEMERLADYLAIYTLFTSGYNEMPFFWVGAGPGMYGSVQALKKETSFFKKYLKALMDRSPAGGTLNDPLNQVLSISGDIGPVGLVLFLIMIGTIGVQGICAYRVASTEQRLYPLMFVGIFSHLAGRILIANTFFFNDSLFMLIILYPLILRILDEHRRKKSPSDVCLSSVLESTPLQPA